MMHDLPHAVLVAGLARQESHIVQHHDLSGLQAVYHALGIRADHIRDEYDILAELVMEELGVLLEADEIIVPFPPLVR
jgi:hypothetical protein